MIAYKFLAPGALGPFSDFRWPTPSGDGPGAWVEAEAFPVRGIHALRPGDLPYWLHDELWIAELDPPCVDAPTQLVAARGRLVDRVSRWNAEVRAAFVEDVVARARRRVAKKLAEDAPADLGGGDRDALVCLVDLVDTVRGGDGPAGAAFVGATLAAIVAGSPSGASAEREAQAAWFVRALGLPRAR